MSNRTIVEFNHDLAGEIAKDPDGFLLAIQEMLRSGVNEFESETRIALSQYGVRTTPTHHHTTRTEVSMAHGPYEFYKVRL